MTSFKWFLTFFLAFVVISLICGISELSLLGSGLEGSPMKDIFNVFGLGDSSAGGITAFLNPANWPGILSGLYKMLTWEYAVLDENTFTQVIRVFLYAISAAFMFSLIIWLWSIVKPFGGGSA